MCPPPGQTRGCGEETRGKPMGTAQARELIIDDRVGGIFRVNRRVFTDPEILEQERREVFDRSWLYAGHESELAKPGAFIPPTARGPPPLPARAAARPAPAFLNTCPP